MKIICRFYIFPKESKYADFILRIKTDTGWRIAAPASN